MAALSAIGATLNKQVFIPKSTKTGATSQSDPNAGSTAPANPAELEGKITAGDKVGAVILTILTIIIVVGGAIWLVT